MLRLYSLPAIQLHDVQVMHDVKDLFYKVYSDLFTVARCSRGLGYGLGVVSFRFSFRFLFQCFLNYWYPNYSVSFSTCSNEERAEEKLTKLVFKSEMLRLEKEHLAHTKASELPSINAF